MHKSLNKAMIAWDYFSNCPAGRRWFLSERLLCTGSCFIAQFLSPHHEQSIAISPRVFFCNPIFREEPRCLHLLKTGCFARYRGLLCAVYHVRFGDIPLPLGFALLFLPATWQRPLMHSRLQYSTSINNSL